MPAKVLDSFALIAYFRDEPGAETMEDMLVSAGKKDSPLLMTDVNYAEVKYSIVKKDGESVSGRITDENAERIVVMPNPMSAEMLEEVRLADIARRTPSKISPMPTGLLNNLTAEEILDLLAYIQAGGKAPAENAGK